MRDGIVPHRGQPPRPDEALPSEVVHLLVNRVGLLESEVMGMTRAQAIERLNRFWVEGS